MFGLIERVIVRRFGGSGEYDRRWARLSVDFFPRSAAIVQEEYH
jgi:hypothetical protein